MLWIETEEINISIVYRPRKWHFTDYKPWRREVNKVTIAFTNSASCPRENKRLYNPQGIQTGFLFGKVLLCCWGAPSKFTFYFNYSYDLKLILRIQQLNCSKEYLEHILCVSRTSEHRILVCWSESLMLFNVAVDCAKTKWRNIFNLLSNAPSVSRLAVCLQSISVLWADTA